jgi:hypothetical protein
VIQHLPGERCAAGGGNQRGRPGSAPPRWTPTAVTPVRFASPCPTRCACWMPSTSCGSGSPPTTTPPPHPARAARAPRPHRWPALRHPPAAAPPPRPPLRPFLGSTGGWATAPTPTSPNSIAWPARSTPGDPSSWLTSPPAASPRAHRSRQPTHQEDQASRPRIPQLRQLPAPRCCIAASTGTVSAPPRSGDGYHAQ